jgi:HSP20 family protein
MLFSVNLAKENLHMTETAKNLPVKAEKAAVPRRPLATLRQEIDRLFEYFDQDFWTSPFRRSVFDVEPLWRREFKWAASPAVDIVEKEKTYEVTAELPGMDEKSIEVKLVNGDLTIKGEKQEEKEEKKNDYYLHERHFGSFERRFAVPAGVDTDKIEASFKKGVLTVTLPKKPEAIKPEKKIEVKTAA